MKNDLYTGDGWYNRGPDILAYVSTASEAERLVKDMELHLSFARQKAQHLREKELARQGRKVKQRAQRRKIPQRVHELIRAGDPDPFKKAAVEFGTFPEYTERVFAGHCRDRGFTMRLAFVAASTRRGLATTDIVTKWHQLTGKTISRRTIEREIVKIKSGMDF